MDLQIKDVADLLQVSQDTVCQWIDEKTIPVYQINDQYRFNRMEVERWMLNRKRDPKQCSFGEKGENERYGTQAYSFFRAIHKGDVLLDVPGETKEEVISYVVKEIAAKEQLDAEGLTELLLDRENLQSTGLGNGVAIPHTRDTFLENKPNFITVAFPKKPIPFDSLDKKPVHVLFFLFASDDKKHLHLLAKIAHFCSQPGAQIFLDSRPAKAEVLEFIKQWESKLA